MFALAVDVGQRVCECCADGVFNKGKSKDNRKSFVRKNIYKHIRKVF